jgi:hypothetical protein
MNNDVLAQIAALPKAPFPQLRKLWLDLFDSDLPGLNRTYIINRLTYRLQELAWDDKTGTLEQRLDAMVKARLGDDLKRERKRAIHRPMVGTKLLRIYQGVEFHVTVLADGFSFDGRKYKSLSRIAEVITGKTWSGPAFFGLAGRKGEA